MLTLYRSYDTMNHQDEIHGVSSQNQRVNIMNTYTIIEVQNSNSTREGTKVQAKDLASAKRAASKMQCFYGTVLKVLLNGNLLAIKENGAWSNV